MKLLLDMNMSERFVALLSAAGHEAFHWSALGEVRATDSNIMEYALTNNLVVITFDLDFGTILSATREVGPSVVIVRRAFAHPEDIIVQLLMALENTGNELSTGALVVVEPKRVRVRPLPV